MPNHTSLTTTAPLNVRAARNPRSACRRRWSRRALRSLIVAIVSAGICITGCMPGGRATRQQIAALERCEIPTIGHAGRSVSYLRAGEETAPRVIFIHGSPGSAADYADYLVWPPADIDVIAVDRLGFGKSITSIDSKGRSRCDDVVSFSEQAAAIRPLLVQRHGRWPILIGHSLGGPIAAQVAADYPDQVGGIIILAGALDPAHESPRWYNEVLSWRALSWLEPRAIAHSNSEMMVTFEQTTALANHLDRIRCDVTVIHGVDDPLVSIANADYIQSQLTNAASMTIIRIPGEGHFLPWKRESRVREELKVMMERHTGDDTPGEQ